MNIEQAVYNRLTGYSGLAALVSTRVYPEWLPENPTLPAVTYRRVDGPREIAIGGTTGLAHPRVQVECWATTYSGAKAVAAQARAALDGYQGTLGGTGGVNAVITLLNEFDLADAETGWRRVVLEVVIWHQE